MKTVEVSDDHLMERVAGRDRLSFKELHNRFAGVIYMTAYRVLNNPSDAEEVSQEVFAQIWQKAGLYERRRGTPITWASTMARNRAIDRLRSNRRRFRLKDDYETEEEVLSATRRSGDALDHAGRLDDILVLRKAMADLTDEQRESIEMVYFRGLTQKEVAERLGQPLGTIKARVRRGLAKLREVVPGRLDG